jgi:hypothetical protein
MTGSSDEHTSFTSDDQYFCPLTARIAVTSAKVSGSAFESDGRRSGMPYLLPSTLEAVLKGLFKRSALLRSGEPLVSVECLSVLGHQI